MLVAAAVCPHPPLLIPEAMGAGGWPETETGPGAGTGLTAASEAAERGLGCAPGVRADLISSEREVDAQIRQLRAECYAAVRDLVAAEPDLVVVVGGGIATKPYPGTATGSLLDLGIPFQTGPGEPVLPLSLTVGSWLILHCLVDRPGGEADPPRPFWQVELQEVARSAPPATCLALGARLAASAPRVAMLAMGDASARKVLGMPGAADLPAERYDAQVAVALAAGDADMLAELDPGLDDDFLVAGRAAWQVLAGAALGGQLRGQLRYAAAPLDVGYLVASWAS